ncbi:nuclear pore membrane glycoprotein 210 isoform X2 [Contarinia nasturtii]|uniref:nuclear pore membrane glycoprotein 210 isoform X2 n=1 Tax=Contarinia nasturtii TaxID=265458 RepID=UPI0012D4ACB4|nr:nuclear pore membrane glycoprotein 210 isoform X2 [Contarinia nasturtii]
MKVLLIFCCLFAFAQQINAIKLNYPRVLLPIFDKLSINFTLEVIEGGCFKWSSSRPDLITITPIYDDADSIECSSKAVLTTVFREKRRSTAFVLAKDLATGEILRSDVILDVIDKLDVLTTTRELYLEEAPETFKIWAQDSQGNAFTTLEGVEFNWKISSQHPVEGKERDWQRVLRFLRFSESKYHDVPSTVEKFDRVGLKGYMVLLEGINTGSARVSVDLPYAEYQHIVAPVEVNIVVLANILLDPSDVHILVGDSISFRILQLKQGKLEDITSNTQYYLEVENSEFATLDGNIATGHKLGRTAVILKDRNVANNLENTDSIPSIQATLTISRPDKITINLLPYYNWLTVKGEEHTISINLYTNDNQLITLGDAYSIGSQYDTKIFSPLSSTVNGSHIIGEAVSTGSSAVLGSFEKLKATAELQVFEKLVLNPSIVFLPYDPNHLRRQKIQYKANGGDGLYTWSSLNGNLIGINQNGLAETRTGNQVSSTSFDKNEKIFTDFTQIKVALQRNSKISKTADIFFLPPTKLEIVRYNFETTLKDFVYLHVALYADYDGKLVSLTSCDNLHFEYDMLEEIFHTVDNAELPTDEQLHPSACHLVKLQSHGLGSSHFKISYTVFDRILHAEVNLMVFEKLDILNPISNEIVLPIGASRNVIYQNGPQKVFNIDAELVKNVRIDETIASVTPISNAYAADKHILNVLCRKVGSTLLTFEIYNTLSANNHIPYVSKFETHVNCVKPRFINLYTAEKLRQGCPLKVKNSLMHVRQNDNQIDITIDVLDAQNRKLQNISSLILSWQFLQADDNRLNYDIVYERKTEEDSVAGVKVPKRDFLLTTLPEVHNAFKIKASVDRYDQVILYEESIYAENPEFGITQSGKTTDDTNLYKPTIENELNFLAVNSTLLPFDSVSIFLAPNHQQRIQLIQGSGFYEIKVTELNIINAIIDNDRRQIVIEPLRIGQVQIDIMDRCLQTESSRLTVSVVSIGRIEVQVADRVEKTKTIEAVARLYDSLDNPLELDYDNLKIYELREKIWNPNVLNIEIGHLNDLETGEIRYFITGTELGETKLTITSGSGEKSVSSPAYPIQVFPPLRLLPRNTTIVIGSSVQIEAHGGPQPDVNIIYSVENENIVSMDLSVAKGQRLGTTVVIGRCVGINPVNSQKIVYSEDKIEINVVPLNKVKIHSPLRRVRSGTILPASIWGVPNISPLVLGTLNSKVRWSTSQPDVIKINGIFSEAGIEYEEQDSISVRLKALNPGTARIQAEFTTSTGTHSCFVEITVFKLLELELPRRITSDAIIVPPRSQINLKANLPDAQFRLVEETVGGLKVSSDGILRTSDHIGRDLIIAKSDDQTLSIPIETKNIHYVLATLHTPSFKLRQLETKIPSGMNIILKVSLHDNLGNEFSHGIQDTSILVPKLATQDGIEVNFGSNFTVSLNLPRQTSNMLSVSLKNAVGVKYNEDFIKLSVSKTTSKFPTKKIFSVGDIICFDSPLVSIGDWTSSDETVLRVDRTKGIGVARGSRQNTKFGEQVTITNGDGQYGFIKYDLEVREADTIEFYQINDIFNGKTYQANLIIKNHLQIDKLSNLIAKNATTCLASFESFREKFFTCALKQIDSNQGNAAKILDLLNVGPTFDKQFGSYACEIELKPKKTLSDLINLVQGDDIQFELVASLSNGISTATNIKIMPAINVYPLELVLEQIDQQSITVTGIERILQRVQVTSSDASAFEIVPTKAKNAIQYKIKTLKNIPLDETAFIIVNSPLTMQTIQIPIQSLIIAQKCMSQPFQSFSTVAVNIISNIGLIVSMLIILSATIWAFIYCFSSNSARVEDPSPFQKTPRKQIPITNLTSSRRLSPTAVRQPLYPDQSFGSNTSQTSSILHSSASPIYGDSTLISPNKRMNRRYL